MGIKVGKIFCNSEYTDFPNKFFAILHYWLVFMFIYCRKVLPFLQLINSTDTTPYKFLRVAVDND